MPQRKAGFSVPGLPGVKPVEALEAAVREYATQGFRIDGPLAIPGGVPVPHTVLSDNRLSAQSVRIYAAMLGFVWSPQESGELYTDVSNATLAAYLGVDETWVKRNKRPLVRYKYITNMGKQLGYHWTQTYRLNPEGDRGVGNDPN